MSERFEGNFIESADLMQAGEVTLTITDVVPPGTEKAADGRVIDKPIVAFEGTAKRFVVGKTNERLLKAQLGTKGWKGKQITLSVRVLAQAFGQSNVPTIRVVLPEGVPMPFGCRKHYGKAIA